MANSSTIVILVSCILLVSFSLANSAATCPVDVVLRLDSCSNLAAWLNGGGNNPTKAQCCRVIGGLDSQRAADCLCVVLKGDLAANNVDSTIGLAFKSCNKPKPANYQCL